MTVDVAAAAWNAKCERYFTKEDDALTKDWDAKANWCNPPYSADIIDKFVRKAIDASKHETTTCCLLPWWNYPYLDLCEQNGRIHRICSPVSFRREDGTTVTLNSHYGTSPLVVVVFGPTIQPGFGEPIRKNGSDNPHVGGGEPSAEPGPTVQCDEDGDDGVEQEGDGQPVAVEEPPAEPPTFTDDELRKAHDYVASFEDQFRALAVLEHVVCGQDVRSVLTQTIRAARAVLAWGEIREIVTAAELKSKGVKVERL
jgi:hypothetical protein